MSDQFDYSSIIAQQQARSGYAGVAATDGVSPDQAATAIQHGPAAGVPASAGMYQPDEVRQQAQTAEQQAVLQRNARIARWAATTDPAHVAAAKDALPSLEEVQRRIDPYGSGYHPATFLAGLKDAWDMMQAQADQGKAQYKKGTSDKEPDVLHALWDQTAGAFTFGTAFLAPFQNAVQGTTYQAAKAAGNDEKTARAMGDLMATDVLTGEGEAGILAHPGLPGRGHPQMDQVRAATATVDAAKASSLQEGIAASPIHARSPDTIADFIQSQQPDRVVHVDPDAVVEHVLGQGHELPWPELGPQLASAVAHGDMLEVPFERYHTALAGQPYTEALNANSIFREGGVTLEEAKRSNQSSFKSEPIAEGYDLHNFEYTAPNGELVTGVIKPPAEGGGPLEIDINSAGSVLNSDTGGANRIGIAGMRQLLEHIQQAYPDATEITGLRTTGARSEPTVVSQPLKPVKPTADELPSDFTAEETSRATTLAAKAESAVQQIFREQYLKPMPIEHGPAVGMTEAELLKYGDEMRAASEEARARAVDAAVRQIKREREPDWKDAVARHTEAARTEIEGQRNVQAMRALSEDGNKLDRDILKAAYPELQERLPGNIQSSLGLIPDDFAELLGYKSGKDMLNDLSFLHQAVKDSGSRNLEHYIERRAKLAGQAGAERELGSDFFTPEGLRELAMQLVPEDKAEGTLIDELRYLAKQSGHGSFNVGDVKVLAKESFAGQRVADVTSLQRLNDRIFRLAEKAQQALAKGQFGAAFGYKQLQFMRRLQLKEALRFRKEFDSTAKSWAKLAGSRTMRGLDQTALNFVHAIQAEMGYSVSSHVADMPQIMELPSYVDSRNQLGGEVMLADVPRGDSAKSLAKNLGAMTVDQFRGVRDMITSIVKDGRNQQQVVSTGKAMEADAVRTATINSLNRYSRAIDRQELESPTLLQKLDATRRGWDATMVRMEQLLLDFTGRDPDHPLMDIWHKLQEGKGWKDDKLIEIADHFKELDKKLGKGFGDWLEARVGDSAAGTGYNPLYTEKGDDLLITNKDVVVAAAHMGDAQALRKFAEGYDTTPAAVEAIVHKHMTDDAWTYVQGLWDAFGKMAPDVQAAYLRRNGVHLQMIEPRPFEVPANSPATAGRKIAGGYYPIQYDFDNLPQHVQQMVASDDVLGSKEYRSFLPSSNYMKARTKFSAPIDMSLDMVYTRLRQMAHDLAFRDSLVDLQKVLLHKDVTDAIGYRYGPEYVDTIRQYIKDVAGAETGGGKGMRTLTRAINYMSNAQQISLIGFNPGTVLKHGLTAAFHSMQTVGPLPFARSSIDLFRQLPDGILGKLDEESSELRYRMLNANERAREYFEKLQGEDNWRAKLQRASVYAISELDKWSARQVYMAAKQGELDRQLAHGLPLDEQKAIAMGDQAVRQAHGSTGVTDTAQILRTGNDLWGALASSETRFMNFLNHNYNRMREIGQAFGYGGEAVDPARALGLLLTYGFITGGVGALTAGEFAGAKGGVDLGKGVAASIAHVTLGSIPILQNIAGAAAWVAGGMKGTPRGGMLMQLGFMYGRVILDATQVAGDKNPNSPAHRRHVQHLITSASDAALTTFQLPGNAVAKLQRLGFQLSDPQANPKRKPH